MDLLYVVLFSFANIGMKRFTGMILKLNTDDKKKRFPIIKMCYL